MGVVKREKQCEKREKQCEKREKQCEKREKQCEKRVFYKNKLAFNFYLCYFEEILR